MDLRCKPGDLAVIVAVEHDYQTSLLGKIIRVTHQYDARTRLGQKAWAYEPELRTEVGGRVIGFFDEELRPIRDPGEDASDETLGWLPVPEKVTA